MALPYPQNAADWVTQAWNIAFGRRMDDGADGWLYGPIGRPGETGETFIARLATEENLRIARNVPGTGLLDDFARLGVGVHPGIETFYTRTTDFEIRVRPRWRPAFAAFGALVAGLFSGRIQQLHLPRSRAAAARIESEIIMLADAGGAPVYRVWYRRERGSSDAIFYGIYASCQIPSGEVGLKVIFPLPHGSATVVFRPSVGPEGNLTLLSQGRNSGDPGFYFLVEDQAGARWKHYLRSFREKIEFFADAAGHLGAHHSMSLWGRPVYEMQYEISEKRDVSLVGRSATGD